MSPDMPNFLCYVLALASVARGLPQSSSTFAPTKQLDYATFRGNGFFSGVDSFLGMPFAKAGRLENPRLVNVQQDALSGTQDATQYGLSCPQQQLIASPLANENAAVGAILAAVEQVAFAPIGDQNQGEDCLNINVQAPAGVNSTAGLPVLFWIHGGGSELGSSAALGSETTSAQGVIYQGARLVQRSVEMGQPIVFVSANHRLNAFGAFSARELNDAGVGNLILKDERVAMKWTNKYIRAFGGDPSRVTIFGESAGSFDVATHMVLNGGDPEGLFSSAIMASGGILKLKPTDSQGHGQDTFDFIASETGCGDASDKVTCLKSVDYSLLYNAVQRIPNFLSYSSTKLPWYSRADGQYLRQSPYELLRKGEIADIPFIIGDMKDEGTLFSVVPQLNVTTDADFQQFWQELWWPTLSAQEVKAFTDLYSQDITAGSPYDTGIFNAIGPQYKRLASSIGDITFETGRRDLLEQTYNQGKRRAWTYQIDQSIPILGQLAPLSGITGLPALGSFHASDVLLNTFGLIPATVSKNTLNLMSTYISFVNSQDPNNHGLDELPYWPTWTPTEKDMFRYKESGPDIIADNYREEQMRFINDRPDIYAY